MFLLCALVLHRQLVFAQQRDLGFDAEQVVVVQLRGPDSSQLGQRFIDAARALPGVTDATLADREFSVSTRTLSRLAPDGSRHSLYVFSIDPGFLSTLGIELARAAASTPTVIGVVPGFHFRSLKEAIAPAVFTSARPAPSAAPWCACPRATPGSSCRTSRASGPR